MGHHWFGLWRPIYKTTTFGPGPRLSLSKITTRRLLFITSINANMSKHYSNLKYPRCSFCHTRDGSYLALISFNRARLSSP